MHVSKLEKALCGNDETKVLTIQRVRYFFGGGVFLEEHDNRYRWNGM